MLIGICGYGYSGSSAFIDLFREFDKVDVLNQELHLIHEPDGITDLKQSLVTLPRRNSSSVAIMRYKKNIESRRNRNLMKLSSGKFVSLTRSYIDSLIEVSWRGYSQYDPVDCQIDISLLSRALRKLNSIKGNSETHGLPERYFSILSESEFKKITSSYLKDTLTALGLNSGVVVVDQLFDVINPTEGMDYFEDPYAIIVDRDPRDMYIITNHIYSDRSSFMPNSGDVEAFIKYYIKTHNNRCINNRVIHLKFEDLIYNYDATIEYIENLVQKKDYAKGRYFKPELSISNTNLIGRFPQYKAEIERIEHELAEYLYDFEKERNLNYTPANCVPFDA